MSDTLVVMQYPPFQPSPPSPSSPPSPRVSDIFFLLSFPSTAEAFQWTVIFLWLSGKEAIAIMTRR